MQPFAEVSRYSNPISLSSLNDPMVETEFCEFYAFILRKMYPKFRPNFRLIWEALHSLRKYIEPGISAPLPDYENSSLRMAYLFSFSIMHSIVMYDRFRDMLEINPTMLMKILSMKELNMCILGGGPGFEAVSVCKLLQKAKKLLVMPDTYPQLRIHLTVIDLYEEWKPVTECLFTKLQEESHPLITADFCYVQANLTKELSPAVIEAIKRSHIVTMFKFVYGVYHRYGCKNVEKMLKRIVENMSFKSCLFFLDNARGGYFKTVDEMITYAPCMTRIYGPVLHQCQELKKETVEKYSSYVHDRFRNLNCTSKTTISCSAWLKIRHPCKKAIKLAEEVKKKKVAKKKKTITKNLN